MLVSNITFFIKTASVPEKIKANTLYKTAVPLPLQTPCKIYVPDIISKIPIIDAIEGSSPRKKKPNANATIGLYEFMGARTDSSPSDKAFIIK